MAQRAACDRARSCAARPFASFSVVESSSICRFSAISNALAPETSSLETFVNTRSLVRQPYIAFASVRLEKLHILFFVSSPPFSQIRLYRNVLSQLRFRWAWVATASQGRAAESGLKMKPWNGGCSDALDRGVTIQRNLVGNVEAGGASVRVEADVVVGLRGLCCADASELATMCRR